MDEIWILNVGDLKFLETPLEYFLSIAYDGQNIGRQSLIPWLRGIAVRDYGDQHAGEIAEIMALYSVSRVPGPVLTIDVRLAEEGGAARL